MGLILAIVCVASSGWLLQDNTEDVDVENAGIAKVTTTASFGLTRYSLERTVDAANRTYTTHEKGSVYGVVDIGVLSDFSKVTLSLLIIAIILTPFSAYVTFVHGWARGKPLVVYVIACVLTCLIALLLLNSFIVCGTFF